MSGKVVVKKVSVLDEDKQAELRHYFDQMTGSETPDIEIVAPKFDSLMDHMRALTCAFNSFGTVVKKYGAYESDGAAMLRFAERISTFTAASRRPPEGSWVETKSDDIIQICMQMCNNLIPIKSHLAREWDAVDCKFMDRYPGQLTPFPFAPRFDVRYLWMVEAEEVEGLRSLIFEFLKMVFERTHNIFRIVYSPDVNMANFSQLVVSAIGDLRKQIPRCERAFTVIERSVSMFETNFDEYYLDFMQTNDPSVVFSSFISDIATDSSTKGSDPQLIYQCRRIVQFYRKNAKERTARGQGNSKHQQMFEALLKTYKIADKDAAQECGIADEPDEPENPSPAEPPQPSEPAPDTRDLDELMRQINDPRKKSIS